MNEPSSVDAALVEELRHQLAEALAENAVLREQLARYRRGPSCRSERCRRRNEALAAFGVDRCLASMGRGVWPAIHYAFTQLRPELALTADPPGPLDTLSLEWVTKHTVNVSALRIGYWRFIRSRKRAVGI